MPVIRVEVPARTPADAWPPKTLRVRLTRRRTS